jgi:hypothetical protein
MDLKTNEESSMFRVWKIGIVAVFGLLLVACGAQAENTPTNTPDHAGINLPTESSRYFAGSGVCANCHTDMVDENGNDVSIDSYWRSTMMANAARDPYFQASVRKELVEHPEIKQKIEDKCATCHTPMARFTVVQEGGRGELMEDGFLNPENRKHPLAMDGVSCSVCHQIQERALGQVDSFSGNFRVDTRREEGERLIYGPYSVEENLASVMQGGSGFIPTQGDHLQESELCATCHTLYTPTIDKDTAEIGGEFPEQTPYLEWLNSEYRGSKSCQDCHMPEAEGGVVFSTTGGEKRSPFSRHAFVGGNAYMLQILKTFGDELQVTASEEQFTATLARVRDQLQKRTAHLNIEPVVMSGSTLKFKVTVQNQAGHKFPTGFPSRRAWIHLTVRDQLGQVVFESGAYRADGSIVGNDNDDQPAAYEPHYEKIVRPGQVQIYEAIMKDTQGSVTTTLLYGAGYLKDDRLLPKGFDKAGSPEDIAVLGSATGDGNFSGGGDAIQYLVDVRDAQGPFTITGELLYQSIGYRWIENLRGYQESEVKRFLEFAESVSNEPVVVAESNFVTGKD